MSKRSDSNLGGQCAEHATELVLNGISLGAYMFLYVAFQP